jgi:hypothetical protein
MLLNTTLLLTVAGSHAGPWGDLLWAIALLTMAGGNLLAIGQPSVKRMLAYSSVAHTGYVLAAVGNGALSMQATPPIPEGTTDAELLLIVLDELQTQDRSAKLAAEQVSATHVAKNSLAHGIEHLPDRRGPSAHMP